LSNINTQKLQSSGMSDII